MIAAWRQLSDSPPDKRWLIEIEEVLKTESGDACVFNGILKRSILKWSLSRD